MEKSDMSEKRHNVSDEFEDECEDDLRESIRDHEVIMDLEFLEQRNIVLHRSWLLLNLTI